jgi:hypothetical protein
LVKSAVAGLSLLALAGGYWAYSMYRPSPTTHLSSNAHPQKPTVATPSVTVLDIQASALLADAQRFHRSQEEIDSLTDSNTQIAALASQLHGLGAKPGDRTKVRTLFAQMNTLAVNMAHSEATALQHAGAQLWRDLEKTPGKSLAPDAAAAIAKAQQTKTSLDNAVAAAEQAQDGSVSLKATRQALATYDAFATACEAVTPFYISARRSDFAALVVAARSISDRLVALGRVDKPWLLASRARKDAYQTLSSNATEAQAQVAQLDDLQHRADAATSLKKMSAAMSRASAIKARLSSLLANSDAAYSIYSQ